MLMRFDSTSEFDRLTRSLWNEAPAATVPLDAFRRGDNYVIQMDLPGIDLDTLDLTVERNALSVSASRMTSQRDGDKTLIAERQIGRFTRQLFLGEDVDVDNIDAGYSDGVLTLTIPVANTAKPRRISVKRDPAAVQCT